MIHDVCLMRLNVLFAMDRAGLVPNDGETHQGIYDPAFFSEMRVETYSPANYAELEYWLTRLVRHPNGPRAIRYPRGEEKPSLAALGCSGEQFDFIDRQEGADTVLVSYGAEAEEALAACDLLLQKGVRADCCKLVRIVPLPEGICKALAGYKTILFAEECVRDGGIGQQLCFALQQSGWRGTFLLHAVDNRHLLHANVPQLRKDQALDAAALADSVLNILTSRSME